MGQGAAEVLSLKDKLHAVVAQTTELFQDSTTGPFQEELIRAQRDTILSRTVVLIWMSLFVMPSAIWGFTGYFEPDQFTTAIAIVLTAIAAVLVIRAMIVRGMFDKHYHLALALVVGGVFSPVASAILALTRNSDGNYLFAYFLIYFAFMSLFPTSVAWVLITSGLVIAGYIGVYLAIVPDGLDATMVSNILYMVELTFMGVILNRVICRLFFDEKRIRMELYQANSGLMELDQTKTRFFSNMNHELRTLLTLILTPLSVVLQRRDLPDEVVQTLLEIRTNSTHLLKTVNLLLDFSRLEAGQVQVNNSEVRIPDLLEYTISLFRGASRQRGLRLVVDCQTPELTMLSDLDKVEQMLVNLIGNAFKFTPEGGTITLSSRRVDDTLTLSVRDTGIGIAPADQKLIFQRFGQVQDAQKASIKGTGIGLSMVQEYAKLLGGSIGLASTVGEGSTFFIHLPIVEPMESADSSEDLESRAEIQRALAVADLNLEIAESTTVVQASEDAPWVLVVDDNPSLVRLVSSILASDYNLYRASSGEEALERLAESAVDLVISDVMMPGITGLELCRRIKSDERTQTIPVILLTARGSTARKIEGLDMGADDYIGKPFDPDELRARVRSLFERRLLMRRLEEKSAELSKAMKELKDEEVKLIASEKLRTLGDLAAGIFHELHNYMNMLYNGALPLTDLVEMLQEEPENVTEEDFAEILELAALITDAAKASLSITGELKAYAHHAAHIHKEEDLHEVISSNIRMFGKLDAGLEIVCSFTDRALPISCVPSRMLMVFTNLIKNAFDAMGGDGTVTITTSQIGDSAEVRIADTGPGVPASFQDKLFEPFQTTKTTGQGLGLGLSLASKVISDLGGELRYDADYTDGACFVITIPLTSSQSIAA